MMMDTAIQQTNNTVAQTPVTPLERQTIIQRLYETNFIIFQMNIFRLYRHSKWPLDLATRVENQAYEKSHGMKVRLINMYRDYR